VDDSLLKAIAAGVGTIVLGVLTYLGKAVLDLKESFVRHEAEIKQLKEDKVTRECIREEIENALVKRDVTAETLRKNQAEVHRLEVKEAVREAVEAAIPRIVREVRGSTALLRPDQGSPPS
jgi:hypothetical protein